MYIHGTVCDGKRCQSTPPHPYFVHVQLPTSSLPRCQYCLVVPCVFYVVVPYIFTRTCPPLRYYQAQWVILGVTSTSCRRRSSLFSSSAVSLTLRRDDKKTPIDAAIGSECGSHRGYLAGNVYAFHLIAESRTVYSCAVVFLVIFPPSL